MKKIFTLLFIVCSISFLSCTKDVKTPVKASNSKMATLPNSTTQTTTQNQSGHTCGGDHSSGNGY